MSTSTTPNDPGQPSRAIAGILDAARAVLLDDPNASMIDIAERAGVHRSTLHRNFASREALVAELTRAASRAFEARIAEAGVETGDAREAMRRATAAWFAEFVNWKVVRYAPLAAYPRGEAGAEGMRGLMLGVIERGQRDGTIRDDRPAFELYIAWVSLIIGWNAFMPDSGEPEAMADALIAILLPEPRSMVMNFGPVSPGASPRLVLELDGDTPMRLRLDDWKPAPPG